MMRLVVLGAPGAGKGTQANALARRFDVPHVSTGDMLRGEMRRETPLGRSIEMLMNGGQYVPDEIVIEMVKAYVRGGYVLDGFPRTLRQAETLTDMEREYNAPITKVISIDVADEVIMERMSGREVCPLCGQMFHKTNYPSHKPGICDQCGGALVQREDDKAKTVENRLKLYHEFTKPIIEYYSHRGLLLKVSGEGAAEDITARIVKALEGNEWQL